MFRKLADAFFIPAHSAILVPLIWIGIGLCVADQLAFTRSIFAASFYLLVLAYGISVGIHLDFIRRAER